MNTMDGFGDVGTDLSNLGQNILNSVQQEAIGGAAGVLLQQPGVQQALQASAQQQANQSLIQQLTAGENAALSSLQQNKNTLMLMGLGLAGIVIWKMMRPRRA